MSSPGHHHFRSLAAPADEPTHNTPPSTNNTSSISNTQHSTVPIMSMPPASQKFQRYHQTNQHNQHRGHGRTQSHGQYLSSSSSPSAVSLAPSNDNHTLHITENLVYPQPPRFPVNSPGSTLHAQHNTDLEYFNQNTNLDPPPLGPSSSTSSFHRPLSPSIIPSRPNSRGVNFSRPSTFYKLEHTDASDSFLRSPTVVPPKPPRQDSLSSASDDNNSSRFYSPNSSPTKSSLPQLDSDHRQHSNNSNSEHHPPSKIDDVGGLNILQTQRSNNSNNSSSNSNTQTQTYSDVKTGTPTSASDYSSSHSATSTTPTTDYSLPHNNPHSQSRKNDDHNISNPRQPNWQSFIPPPSLISSRSASGTSTNSDNIRTTVTNLSRQPSTGEPLSPGLLPMDFDDGGKKPFSTFADKHKSMAVFTGNSDPDPLPPVPSVQSTDADSSASSTSKKRPKICFACDKVISGHFVRALNRIYHMDCFTCFDCSKPCSAKFFPVENSGSLDPNSVIPLCEQCYFRRQDLLCCACDGALRGSYITALGKKYHVEHFTCSLCSTVFGSDDSYYEHEDNIYCRYHYSTLYAAKCEGCKTAILKQFVEVFRGGREQQWHPECYMINKFWNVMIFPDNLSAYPSALLEDEPQSAIGRLSFEDRQKASLSPNAESREAILQIEQEAEKKSYHIWSILCGYEEASAACISDMLQFATSCRYHETLLSTAMFVAKIEVLLSAIDILSANIDPLLRALIENDKNPIEVQDAESPEFKSLVATVRKAGFTQLRKEPKTLCKKVVSFMSLLSKSRERSMKEPGPTQELLDSVTGMAHYLKLLIRHGLSNALRYDRAFSTGNIVDKFLEQVATHDQIPLNPLESLGVSGTASDRCLQCGKSTEDDCATLNDKQWHLDCLQCIRCQSLLGSRVKDVRYLVNENAIICESCRRPNEDAQSDFVVVTKLHQFVYLVKIALARLQLVLQTYDTRDKVHLDKPVSLSRPSLQTTRSSSSVISSRRPSTEPGDGRKLNDQGYMTTLKDIRKLRSTRLSQRLSESSRIARRSRILDMPPSERGFFGKNDSTSSLSGNVKESEKKDSSFASQKPGPLPIHLSTNRSSSLGLTPKSPIITDDTISSMSRDIHPSSPHLTFQVTPKHSNEISPPISPNQSFTSKPRHNSRKLKIEDYPPGKFNYTQLDRTTDLIRNEKSLILDDIPRIVAAEQARELRPNAFRHRMKEASQDDEVHVMDVHEKKQIPERFMSELSATELFYVRHVSISLMQPMVAKWFSQEELADLIELRKASSIWEKFGKAFKTSSSSGVSDPKNKKKTGVFGVSLEQQVERFGVDSTFGVGPGTLRIPAFIDECVSAMRQMDMSIEGIFRKNGNIRRSKELAEMVDKNPGQSGMFTDENPIQVAALFKKYLRDLPDSLLTFKLQKLWLISQEVEDVDERKRLMHLICCLLPTSHRDVMEVLFYFLYWTASFSHIDEESGSKMDIHNLSTVITPNILYPKRKDNSTPESSEGYFLAIEAVDVLIKEHDRYAKVPPEVLDIVHGADLQSCGDLSSKDILHKIQQYIFQFGLSIPALKEPDQPDGRLSTSSEPGGKSPARVNEDKSFSTTNFPTRPSPVRAHTDNGRSGNEQSIKQVLSPAIL